MHNGVIHRSIRRRCLSSLAMFTRVGGDHPSRASICYHCLHNGTILGPSITFHRNPITNVWRAICRGWGFWLLLRLIRLRLMTSITSTYEVTSSSCQNVVTYITVGPSLLPLYIGGQRNGVERTITNNGYQVSNTMFITHSVTGNCRNQ